MNDMGVQFSKDDFEMFKRECRWWLDRFGLHDLEAYFIFGVPSSRDDAIACTGSNYTSMRVTLYFNRTLDSDDVLAVNKEELIRNSAQHEVLEVLMSPLEHLALARDWDSEAYEAERHRIIHRVQRALRECAKDVLREAMDIHAKQ